MELVELDNLKDAIVGLPGITGLSTEQRKRLTIAVELVANPSIIFMDEPTSGLDARAAAIVMRAVRNTVDTGRTVVCTIHQPSIDIFESFDEVMKISNHMQFCFLLCFCSLFSWLVFVVSTYSCYLPLSVAILFTASTNEERRPSNILWTFGSKLAQDNRIF